MMKTTICCLLYGDYPKLAERCLTPISKLYSTGAQVRIGCNDISKATESVISSLFSISDNLTVIKATPQMYKYPMMRALFNIKPDIINEDKLVVHIRETDYVGINKFLGYSFYRKLINDSKFTDVVIVTDNSDCDTVKRLVSDGCKVNTEGTVRTFDYVSDQRAMNDFNVLLHSENIAISQSSFSWWAAFLGNHNKVFLPYKINGGMWSLEPGPDDIDLYINRPNSIKYIND